MITSRVLADGNKNHTVLVTGALEADLLEPAVVVTMPSPSLKLSSAIWLIQEKLGLILWWRGEELLFPMESRNSVRFDRSLDAPKDWDGRVLMTSFGFKSNAYSPKHFTLLLDFDK